jgi:F0F1-type ATP synthase assembly protein I
MTRAQLDQWLERGILVLVLALLVYSPLAYGALRQIDQPIIQGLAIVCAGLWLVRLWFGEVSELVWPPICWALVAFVLYAVLRYRQAEIEYVARGELLKVLCYAFLFLVVLNNLSRQESARVMVVVLLVLGVGLSIYAVYQYFSGSLASWS